jgi:DNA modification methylase
VKLQPIENPASDPELVRECYRTGVGTMFESRIEDALNAPPLTELEGKVNLIMTSPPFPLVTPKQYGNETGERYVQWLADLAPKLAKLLTDDGSIVIEIGNSWTQGSPVMSTLPLEALLAFKKAADLHLCQHVICHNTARLPSPAAWVTVKRIRLKDSYTHVWWLSKTEYPKADNKKVLTPYSKSMQTLLRRKSYNSGRRPSGHVVSEAGFLKDHGGAIAPNVLDFTEEASTPPSLLKLSNTAWDAGYREYCTQLGVEAHPARMQLELAGFFIQFLTDPGDLIVDPFAGSNTTGAAAEILGRKWIAVEENGMYARASKGRFSTS